MNGFILDKVKSDMQNELNSLSIAYKKDKLLNNNTNYFVK